MIIIVKKRYYLEGSKLLGIDNLLNETANTVGDGDDLVDGVAHFIKKNKTEEEQARIDEKCEDFKAAGKIAKGGLKWIALGVVVAAGLKILAKK